MLTRGQVGDWCAQSCRVRIAVERIIPTLVGWAKAITSGQGELYIVVTWQQVVEKITAVRGSCRCRHNAAGHTIVERHQHTGYTALGGCSWHTGLVVILHTILVCIEPDEITEAGWGKETEVYRQLTISAIAIVRCFAVDRKRNDRATDRRTQRALTAVVVVILAIVVHIGWRAAPPIGERRRRDVDEITARQ